MSSSQQTPLCQYRYDPMDRLTGHTQSESPELQRFYCKSRLATEIQGATGHSIVQHDDWLLAQQQRQDGRLDTTLLATDLQRSVLQTLKSDRQPHPIAYSPYGHRPGESGLSSLLGFNGERSDPVTGHYLLGNGYRAFNSVLMRFNSPDSLSPFGKGGLNSYAYCLGDPVNASDPSGHSLFVATKLLIRGRRAATRQVVRTGEIVTHQYPTSEIVSKLNPGITPKEAVTARAKTNKMRYLMDNADRDTKYLSDLDSAKKHATALEKLTGSPVSGNERLNLLNSIKGSELGSKMGDFYEFSPTKLGEIRDGNFGSNIPIHQRPSRQTAQNYFTELFLTPENSNHKIYAQEIQRLEQLHFQEGTYRAAKRVRST